MYYNKYKLYSPYGPTVSPTEGGGGGSEAGGETGGGASGGASGNGNGDGENGGNGPDKFDVYGNPILPSPVKEIAEKEIKVLEVQNHLEFISAKGESRTIRIIGTPGAGFTLTIKDSSGCSIMEEELENVEIPKSTIYTFIQEFPDIATNAGGGLIKEYYEIVIIPHADVKLRDGIENGIPTFTLYQYPDPTITLATTTSQTSPALNVIVSGLATKKSKAGALGDSIGETHSDWILTITEDSATNGNFYIKNTNFNENITTDSVIKKVVTREVGEDPTSKTINLKPLTTRAIGGTIDGDVTRGDDNFVISGELTAGMSIVGKVEKTKTVTNSLEVPNCKRKTDKFELNNTTDLFKDMFVYIDGVLSAKVTSIDCERNITISKKISIRQNTDVVFKHDIGAKVGEVVSQINSEGNACIKIDRHAYIPSNIELEFDDSSFRVSGITRFSGSGTDSIVLTNTIYVTEYGIKDITYTLDLDNIITRKPNAKDFDIEVSKNGRRTVLLSNGDFDTNKLSKVPSITKNPSHGTVTVYDASDVGHEGPTIVYSAIKDFVGVDEIRYTLKDDDEATDLSDEKTIRITVK
jgi:hypothetical protein